jgi:PAS domain S-box-containing protein
MSLNAAPTVEGADSHLDARRRVLIVDDNRDFADSLTAAIEVGGYSVDTAYDADQAEDRCRAFEPAIVVIDINLDDTNGLDLVPRLQALRPDLLCIMMTAYAEIDTAIKAVREGVYDYLRKPLHGSEVLAALGRGFEVLRLREEKDAAEAAAQREHAQLIDAIESISEGFVLYDADERFVLCNTKYKDFYPQIAEILKPGTKFENVVRKALEDGAIKNALSTVEEWLPMRLEQHRSGYGAHEQNLSDGRWVLCSERKTRNGYTVGIHTDITEIKQREQALRTSEARYARLFDESPVGIWEEDLSEVKGYLDELGASDFEDFETYLDHHPEVFEECLRRVRVLDVNLTGIQMFGAADKAALLEGLPEVLAAEAHEKFKKELAHIRDRIQSFEHEVEVRTLTGEMRHMAMRWVVAPGAEETLSRVLVTTVDITDRKLAEEALRESEERFRAVFEQAAVGIGLMTPGGRFLSVNKKLCAIMRRGRDELMAARFDEFTHPDDYRTCVEQITRLISGEISTFTTEMRYAPKDGDLMWGNLTVSLIRQPSSDEYALLGVVEDITERHGAEDLVRESEERHRLAVEGANDGVWEWDVSSDSIYASDRAFEILGIEPPEDGRIPVEDWLNRLHPGDVGKHMDTLRAHLKGETEFFASEYRVLFGDGTYHWIAHRGRALRDADGRARRMAGSYSDVTERKRAEEALVASEERFRSIVENSPSAIFLKDLEGRYRLVNKRFEEWYGLSQKDVTGKTSHELFPEAFADLYTVADHEVLNTCTVQDSEFVAPHADGSLHTMVATKFPVFGTDGRTIGIGTINTDITHQRRVEEQLHQAQKMEAVGQLTGGIAHDFNNLLTVILGNIELIEDEAGDERLRRFAAAVGGAARRGAELTDQLLIFSRKQTLNSKPIDLGELISGMTRILRRTLGDNVQIETAVAGDLCRIQADPAQLENALLNLAINARDAMPQGGRLDIEATNAQLDSQYFAEHPEVTPGAYVVLLVTDTGAGMSMDILEHVFEPFYTTKEVGEGSGLGLSMVYGFVKQSGGHVEIDSEPGNGTSIRLYLPVSTESDAAAEIKPDVEPEPLGHGEFVLVVEDDVAVRKLTVNVLENLGYRVVEAADGDSALATLEAERDVDLLLSDFMLPGGMNGADIAREASRLRPDIKVLLMSGYAVDRDQSKPAMDGNFEMIRKPYQKAALAQRLRTILEGQPGESGNRA